MEMQRCLSSPINRRMFVGRPRGFTYILKREVSSNRLRFSFLRDVSDVLLHRLDNRNRGDVELNVCGLRYQNSGERLSFLDYFIGFYNFVQRHNASLELAEWNPLLRYVFQRIHSPYRL